MMGRKRRFGLAGILNVFATNLVLQLMLSSNFFGVGVSTLSSQMFNSIVGYTIYGKLVFGSKNLRNATSIFRYASMMSFLWLGNWVGIESIQSFGLSSSLSAIIMIFPLAAVSYLLQKLWVFNHQ